MLSASLKAELVRVSPGISKFMILQKQASEKNSDCTWRSRFMAASDSFVLCFVASGESLNVMDKVFKAHLIYGVFKLSRKVWEWNLTF